MCVGASSEYHVSCVERHAVQDAAPGVPIPLQPSPSLGGEAHLLLRRRAPVGGGLRGERELQLHVLSRRHLQDAVDADLRRLVLPDRAALRGLAPLPGRGALRDPGAAGGPERPGGAPRAARLPLPGPHGRHRRGRRGLLPGAHRGAGGALGAGGPHGEAGERRRLRDGLGHVAGRGRGAGRRGPGSRGQLARAPAARREVRRDRRGHARGQR
mmetsp:Transcript_6883/g.19291  ORF Transcript_6883/g.19291 Transcript_6883/m.19291 type:complete len:213 (-) Transcript_6883:294-932(-)